MSIIQSGDDRDPTEDALPTLAIQSFLACRYHHTAAQFADAHPELRGLNVISLLVQMKNDARIDEERAERLLDSLAILCGSDWPTGPRVMETLAEAEDALISGPLDRDGLERICEQAHEMFNDIVTARPHSVLLPSLLNEISTLLAHLFGATGVRELLDEAVQAQRAAVAATTSTSSDRSRYLDNFAIRLGELHAATGDPGLLHQAVKTAREAVAAVPAASPDRPVRLHNLTIHLSNLYAITGQRELLDEAVQIQRTVLDATPSDSTDRPSRLSTLANHLSDLYAATGERKLLDEAFHTASDAVLATPDGNADRPKHLNTLAHQLSDLYAATGRQELLDKAVQLQRAAVATTPAESTERPVQLNNLAIRLGDLYALTGDRDLLDEAVEAARAAVLATPDGNADRPRNLNTLAHQLSDLYAATGRQELLDEALWVQRAAVATTPAESTERQFYLDTLAGRLNEVYVATGDRNLLDEAVEAAREAVTATPATSTERPGRLNNLANHLSDLHTATGRRELLDEALRVQRAAVAATRIEFPKYLNNLSNRLQGVYSATGDRTLLDKAVEVQRAAVAATPATSTERPGFLNNLTNHLSDLYAATGDRRLLEQAVEVAREAAAIAPSSNTGGPRHLSTLSDRLAELHAVKGDRQLLYEAVEAARHAVAATPATSTKRPLYRNSLSNRLADLYNTTGDRKLLDEAVQIQREVVAATPATSAERPSYLLNLADRLTGLYAVAGDRALLDEAMSSIDAQVSSGPWERSLLARMRARILRLDERRADRFRAAADELSVALSAFRDELARPGLAPTERRDLAQRVDGLLGDVTVTHVRAGMVDRALQFIEGNRMWLHAPTQSEAQPGHADPPSEPSVAVAWVVAGQWETIVITTGDHRDAGQRRSHILQVTRGQIASNVLAAVNATRPIASGPDGPAGIAVRAAHEAIERLCRLTSQIAEVFPAVERLLIVPVGICTMLPFTAATRPDGTFLVDHTAVTIAPSLAWARATSRARPRGPSIGVFHPGHPPHHDLDLREDRQTFAELLGQPVPGRPTADQVLSRIGADTDIVHFSCHGSYNSDTPWDSALELETDLTIQAVLDHSTAPWLVNLSACETAIPDLQATEQHISFPTGFLLGGAAHVLATLWPVDNNYATAVNREFYRQLATKRHPADALRHAILHARGTTHTPARVHATRRPVAATDQSTPLAIGDPYWWAPFTHHGSPW